MPHLLLVDDDDLFRESLGLNLVDEGYEVTSFDNGREALAYLNGGSADIMLLDWRMPELTGIDVLRRMRDAGISIPVIFLTVLSDDIYEQAALEGGAVDFIDKARRLPILLRRLQLIAQGGRSAPEPVPVRALSFSLGQLMLRFDTNRAVWAGRAVDLTLTEFGIVTLLAEKAGSDVDEEEMGHRASGASCSERRAGIPSNPVAWPRVPRKPRRR